MGEIDIIAAKDEYICFIEIKARSGGGYGAPCEAVGRDKIRRIRMLAQCYMSNAGTAAQNRCMRFDVIEICINEHKLRHIINAF